MHEHEEERGVFAYVFMAISAILLLISLIFLRGSLRFAACGVSYLLVGWPVLREAAENVSRGRVFDENFLMAIASLGAFAMGEYPEAAAVMLFYQVGEALQDRAVDKSREAIHALLAVRPDSAYLPTGERVRAEEVTVGTLISVRPGERVPLDGIIRQGSAHVDTSPLTGEALPRLWTVGDTALAGCIDTDGVLTVEVTRPFSDSGVSRIMTLVEEAQEKKARPERFITRFSRFYTPAVCLMAVWLAIIPPLVGWGEWQSFLHKALSFLVISCPCALVLSVPLSFFSGIGCLGHHGILCKGGSDLEQLSRAECAAFDKTGTLTKGAFQVSDIVPAEGITKEQLLEAAACCESQSAHPLAKAIAAAYGQAIDMSRLGQITERSGFGVSAILDGQETLAGRREWMPGADIPDGGQTAVYVARSGQYWGYISLSDAVKEDAKDAMDALKDLGFHDLTLLSGDRQASAEKIAGEVGIEQTFGELLPEDKVRHLEELKHKGITLYAGDGINDAPVLAAADIGIAMGGLGADAAMEAADVVIMSDEPSKIAVAVKISRKTMKIARQNIAFSLAVKLLVLLVSLFADIGLWIAVFADVGVCLLAVLNSLRTLRD